MFKKALFAILTVGLLSVGYVSWPVIEAYRLRQAVRVGDAVTLGAKVDWASVRASLKESVAELISRERNASGSDAAERSMWGSIKLALAPSVAERFIDTYVSAEGIAKIETARLGVAAARGTVTKLGEGDIDAAWVAATGGARPGVLERFMAFYNRIVRAEFHSFDRVAFEIRDRNAPMRRYISEFHLRDLGWKLVSVRVVGTIF